MNARTPNVWTTSAGLGAVLVEQVLQGFPLAAADRGKFDISQWTILVPTRRAARLLEQGLFAAAVKATGRTAFVLPRVRPIGDVDEDEVTEPLVGGSIAPAISKMGQLFLMLQLIDGWAAANPHVRLAGDVSGSRGQALGLAQSLVDLVNQLETEEVALHFEQRFDKLELAEHREAMFSLLHLVQEQLPARLKDMGRMGPAARRNAMLTAEADRIAVGKHHGPIIAAGSTGTNPATRKLLKAIANDPQGAVILPGLDTTLDEDSWSLVTENHPQHAMKILLADMGLARQAVRELSPLTSRVQLLREVTRPAGATAKWHGNPALQSLSLQEATLGLRLCEAPDRHTEARAIALLLREALETPGRRAALVTPDRNLGQQVAEELKRWNAEIDDSGGEPLIRFGRAQLCALVLDCLDAGFSPASLVALLAHPLLNLGQENARHLATLFEISCLRQDLPPRSPHEFATVVRRVKSQTIGDSHCHPVLAALDAEGWDALLNFSVTFAAALQPLLDQHSAPLSHHIETLHTVMQALAPGGDTAEPYGRSFDIVMQGLQDASPVHPLTTLPRAMASIRWALRQETLRRLPRDHMRLAIYGLAEARMIEADLVVLGGLNENLWPAGADPGPWFNRSMRSELGLAQPERAIGITAHDFAQGAAHANVVITWSKRLGTTPLTPSRFVLRLRALLQTLGLAQEHQLDDQYLAWAQATDAPAKPISLPMPTPAPPVNLRPTTLSVTAIEKLIRDPYAIYARRILRLQPLLPLGGSAEPRLRGTLSHAALSRWLQREGEKTLGTLLAAGRDEFADYMTVPEVEHFWWPRFVRMAKAFVDEGEAMPDDVLACFVEVKGHAAFTCAGIPHRLTARADRIDITKPGKVRFIDYKTGTPPSFKMVETGLNPQLTLEAAILLNGTYEVALPLAVAALTYIQIGGGRPPVKVTRSAGDFDVESIALRHFSLLKDLLTEYQKEVQAYLPRTALFKEDETSDYDHLSRFAEWSRSGA